MARPNNTLVPERSAAGGSGPPDRAPKGPESGAHSRAGDEEAPKRPENARTWVGSGCPLGALPKLALNLAEAAQRELPVACIGNRGSVPVDAMRERLRRRAQPLASEAPSGRNFAAPRLGGPVNNNSRKFGG